MGLFLRQDQERSEIQSKVIADLQAKIRNTTSPEAEADPPEPAYLENQHETHPQNVIVTVLFVVLIAVIVFIVIKNR